MATIALSSRYGSKLAYGTGIWGESYRLFAAKFLFGLRYRWCLGIGRVVSRHVADLGMAFVDDWVMGNEKGRYWLSDDIVGLVGSLAM